MKICPCCKRRLPSPRAVKKTASEKMWDQDLAKARYSIACCRKALLWQDEDISFYVAVQNEIERLTSALSNPRLLWSIYRRASKHASYATTEKLAVEVAA